MNRAGATILCLYGIALAQTAAAASLLQQARTATVRVLAQTPAPSTDPDAIQLEVQSASGVQVLRLKPNRTLGLLASRLRGQATAYTGDVATLPGSWVAVTRIGQRWTGLWFDGAHYLGIDQARSLAGVSADAARARPDQHLTFRLADFTTDASFEGDFRVPNAEVLAQQVQTELSQPMRAEELATAAAVLPNKRLSVALIADAQLATQDGTQTQANMLARLNVVDTIFATQVGVHLQSDSVTVMPAGTPPFSTTTVPGTLLTQLSDYRSGSFPGSSQQRSAGLSHLFTGRDLDGSTVGIAYITGLCDNRFSVSLSEARRGPLSYDALIAAHEIGHVFGAPHDGDADGACAATPNNLYLMAPQLNGKSTFSDCSLAQITPVVARAACLAPYDAADGAIDAPAEAPVALNTPTDITVAANSVGAATLTNASLRITVPTSVVLQSASSAIASCSIAGQIADCPLGDLAAGATQSVTFRVLASTAGRPNVQLRITASNDGLSTNNTRTLPLRIEQGADLALSGTLDRSTALVGDSVSTVITLQNLGPADVTDARISITLPAGLTLLQQTSEGVVCAPVTAGLTCGPQPLAAGARMSATLTLHADAAGNFAVTSQASASAPELQPTDNQLQQTLGVSAAAPPAGSGSSGGSSSGGDGGGGGGALSGLALGALGMLAAATAARRQRAAAAK